jgi:fido (protein-threonine AMPylation protein)
MIALEYPPGATPLDPNELGGLKHKHIKTQAELNELEQANVQSGLLWPAFAIQLHEKLLGEIWDWAGKFRTTRKNVDFVKPIQVPVELRMLMDNAKYWAENKTYAPLEAAVRFHHRLT